MNLNELIRKRRSIYPPEFLDKPIPQEVLSEILENAGWAPTYHNTEPWRFKVLLGETKNNLGQFLAKAYRANTPEDRFNPKKHQKIIDKGSKSAAIIAICMKRDDKNRLEGWEEEAAVAMAVQNMWLTCTNHGIGAYWGTPKARQKFGQFLPLEDGEKCLGFFFMGYVDEPFREGNRSPIEEKVQWFKD